MVNGRLYHHTTFYKENDMELTDSIFILLYSSNGWSLLVWPYCLGQRSPGLCALAPAAEFTEYEER